jgi:hypothetical protein
MDEFEKNYKQDYEAELASCDRWVKWCKRHNDAHGMNFYEGVKSAMIFNNIKMNQLIRILKEKLC